MICRRAFPLLAALTAALGALLMLLVAPRMAALAGGEPMLDLRLTGYGPDDLRRLLGAMNPELPGYYAAVVRPLDTAFPVVFTATLALGLWRTAPRARWLVALPVAYGLADLAENAAIARLLAGGPEGLDPGLVVRASALTMAKWGLIGASLVALGSAALRRRR
jgi:hypothetical protein